jgi:hypothetical protein
MKTEVVDSKQKQLSPNDILIIAAHQDTIGSSYFSKISKNAKGISGARIQYTVFIENMKDPSLIRLIEGNTLFVIHPVKDRIGYVRSYNADTARNYVNNIVEMYKAARKMGFDILLARVHGKVSPVLDAAYKKYKSSNTDYGRQGGQVIVVLGNERK